MKVLKFLFLFSFLAVNSFATSTSRKLLVRVLWVFSKATWLKRFCEIFALSQDFICLAVENERSPKALVAGLTWIRTQVCITLNYHPLKFINAGSRTNIYIYKYSFFPRSVEEWNELPETIIEAANTEAFKLALRAQARPHWAFEHFLFLYHQHKFTALFFSAHSTSTAHICWRWAVLPFADQTFRFRSHWSYLYEQNRHF